MFIKNTCSVPWISLLLIGMLAGCGGPVSASFDASSSNNEANLESISITPANPSLAINTSQQCTATGIFSDNTTKDLTSSVTWTSSDADSVDVASGTEAAEFSGTSAFGVRASGASSSPGTIYAKQPGSVRISAKWKNKSGSTDVTVTPAVLMSLAVTPTNPNIAKGTIQQFTATGAFSDSTTQDMTAAVAWNSSTGAVGTISNEVGSKGLASALAAGSSTIAATSGSISGATTLTVTAATLVSIAVTPTNPSIALGTTQHLAATGTFSDNTTQDLTTVVIWGSSGAAVAAISNAAGSQGLTTSVAAGATTISAISGIISGSTILTVTSATLVSIAVTPTNPSIVKGTSRQFTATGTFSDNSTQDLTTAVTWVSSATSVAAISNAAGSRGLSTSVAAGSTTITATSGSVSGIATLTVAGGGAITLTWDAPTTYTDGSLLNPLTGLSTYKIYYGTVTHMYTQISAVPNPGTPTITQTLNLSAGTYYFAVTTVDTFGRESGYSNEVLKTI